MIAPCAVHIFVNINTDRASEVHFNILTFIIKILNNTGYSTFTS